MQGVCRLPLVIFSRRSKRLFLSFATHSPYQLRARPPKSQFSC